MPATSQLHINLSAVDHNIRVLRRLVGPSTRICPVVKSNAYGLGAARLGRRLATAGVDMLAVFSEDEAASLFEASIHLPVLILAPVHSIHRADELYRALVRGNLHLTVHDAAHAERLIEIASKYGTVIPVHLEIDTGMSRGGCPAEEARLLLPLLANHPRLRLAGVLTHFAKARQSSTMTDMQLALLDEVLAGCRADIPDDCMVHVAATAATIRHCRFHKTMIRVGLAWAGYGSELLETDERLSQANLLQPALRWTSSLLLIKRIEPGTPVGYGSRWTATRPTVLGLIPVGYADGYPTALACSTNEQPRPVVGIINEATLETYFAPIIGAVSMDQMIVDLTDVAEHMPLRVGTTVELLGSERTKPNHLTTLAKSAGILPYELLSRLHPSVDRCYSNAAALIEVLDGANAHCQAASASAECAAAASSELR